MLQTLLQTATSNQSFTCCWLPPKALAIIWAAAAATDCPSGGSPPLSPTIPPPVCPVPTCRCRSADKNALTAHQAHAGIIFVPL